MTLTDEELTLYAMREAHLILAAYIEPGAQDAEKTIQELLEVLDPTDVVEAVERLVRRRECGLPDAALSSGLSLIDGN